MEKVASSSYQISEAQYAAIELSADTWVQQLLVALITSFRFLSPVLSPELFEALGLTVLDKVRFLYRRILFLRCVIAPCATMMCNVCTLRRING